jgi:hypothetical protein
VLAPCWRFEMPLRACGSGGIPYTRCVEYFSNCVLKFTQLGAGVNGNENVNMNENDPVSTCAMCCTEIDYL